jgi:serine phosphatase RsbU (regulator of sigma subunit)
MWFSAEPRPEAPAPQTGGEVVFRDTPAGPDRGATLVMRLDNVLGVAGHPKAAGQPPATHMQALIQAGRELADHRPLADLFPVILDLAAKAVGSTRGVLMLLEGDSLVVRAAMGRDFQISRTVRDRVLQQKESLLIQDVERDDDLRLQASIVAQSIRSMIAVPLQAKDKVIGLIYLDSQDLVRPFTKDDLSLITVLANIAAIRIENARLVEVEHNERLMAKEFAQAAEIQRGLLPRSVPQCPGVEVAAFSAPCLSCGGDHYDFFQRPGKLVLLVGDVAGKGMPAALLMASLQARVQVLVEEEIDLAALVTRLNRIIASNCPGNRFITFFICELDLATGELSYVNAGHNPPLVLRRDGTLGRLEGDGMVLGLFGALSYSMHSSRLEEGEVLVMFSDGVTEAEAPGTEQEFGEERLAEVLAPLDDGAPDRMIEQVKKAVEGFAGRVPAADDFTLVIARRTAVENQ